MRRRFWLVCATRKQSTEAYEYESKPSTRASWVPYLSSRTRRLCGGVSGPSARPPSNQLKQERACPCGFVRLETRGAGSIEPIEEHRAGFGTQGSRHAPCPGRIRGQTRMTAEPVSSPKAVMYERVPRVSQNRGGRECATAPVHACTGGADAPLGLGRARWLPAAARPLAAGAGAAGAPTALAGNNTPRRHQHLRGFSGVRIRLHHPHLHSLSSLFGFSAFSAPPFTSLHAHALCVRIRLHRRSP